MNPSLIISKNKINKAGDNIRLGIATQEDHKIIEDWRVSHRAVLNTFQAILRMRTKGSNIIVAQRHKRKSTIYDKLSRHSGMQLSRMDDIAGCRLIFNSINDLINFRSKFHKARFHHKRKNDIDKYDYIKNPKYSGYRGIHDVYEYNVNSIKGISLKGLNVEIQYRTKIQHSWATAVELIGFITVNKPKFQQGDKKVQKLLVYASEILTRAFEKMKGPMPSINNKDLVNKFKNIDKEINIISMLKRLNTIKQTKTNKKNMILIFDQENKLEIKSFNDATEAFKQLFILEKDNPNKDIVFVRADSDESIRLAFKNYYADAKDFISQIEKGCDLLLNKK